jgi:hypothetical protein
VINILNKSQHEIFVQTWKKPTKIFEMLKQVYGEERAHVFEWCKRFSEGRDEVDFDS